MGMAASAWSSLLASSDTTGSFSEAGAEDLGWCPVEDAVLHERFGSAGSKGMERGYSYWTAEGGVCVEAGW